MTFSVESPSFVEKHPFVWEIKYEDGLTDRHTYKTYRHDLSI